MNLRLHGIGMCLQLQNSKFKHDWYVLSAFNKRWLAQKLPNWTMTTNESPQSQGINMCYLFLRMLPLKILWEDEQTELTP